MEDVVRAIDHTMEQLKEFVRENLNQLTLRYLGDVVDHKYEQVKISKIKNAPDETIKNVLNQIQDTILSPGSRSHLSATIQSVKEGEPLDAHAKVVCHYFIKLLRFQQELESKEAQINKFCQVCNKYMVNKELSCNSLSFRFSIIESSSKKEPRSIELRNLSSGEKQIVSLFSHLYLSEGSNYFVLIDEPELSLSVEWQRQFLIDINNGDFCKGLVAVTHSPFIYDNELKKYAHGLGEFIL